MIYSTRARAETFLSGLHEKLTPFFCPACTPLSWYFTASQMPCPMYVTVRCQNRKGWKKCFFTSHHSHVCFGVMDSFTSFWSSLSTLCQSILFSSFHAHVGCTEWQCHHAELLLILYTVYEAEVLRAGWSQAKNNSSGVVRSYFSLEEVFLWGLISF